MSTVTTSRCSVDIHLTLNDKATAAPMVVRNKSVSLSRPDTGLTSTAAKYNVLDN